MKILLIAGTHGNEQAAVMASVKALQQFNLVKRTGDQVDFVIFNRPGLAGNTRVVPPAPPATDDLNRAFGEGFQWDIETQVEALKKRINRSDAVVDVHNSPACDNCILVSNDAYAASYLRFARRAGLHYLLRESAADTIKRYSITHGIPGFTVELGGMGYGPGFDETIGGQQNFVYRLLMALVGITDFGRTYCFGASSGGNALPQQFNVLYLAAHHEGLVEYATKPGDRVEAGNTVFRVLGAETAAVLEEVVAPCDCFLADCEDRLWVKPGTFVCGVQPVIPGEALDG